MHIVKAKIFKTMSKYLDIFFILIDIALKEIQIYFNTYFKGKKNERDSL